jgi:hypothetical protein
MWKNIRGRTPAKLLSDVEIPDSCWKPDFDVVDRYQSFANELMRISLLGIAGYGFLIKEVAMRDSLLLHMLADFKIYLVLGAGCLVLSLSFVLAHRFYSTCCLYNQIMIMRSLKRQENSNWSVEEKKQEDQHIKIFRKSQIKDAIASRIILVSASVLFALGFMFVIIVFYKYLDTIQHSVSILNLK